MRNLLTYLLRVEPKIYLEERRKRVLPRAKYQCECGVIFETNIQNVTSGQTRSCGCLRKKDVRLRLNS